MKIPNPKFGNYETVRLDGSRYYKVSERVYSPDHHEWLYKLVMSTADGYGRFSYYVESRLSKVDKSEQL